MTVDRGEGDSVSEAAVKGVRGSISAVGSEGNAVDGLCVARQVVHLPTSVRRVGKCGGGGDEGNAVDGLGRLWTRL